MEDPKTVQTTEGGHQWEAVTLDNGETVVNIYAFVGDSGYCNGPRCVACGWEGCHHCDEKACYGETCPAA